jgi:hypothetical protein
MLLIKLHCHHEADCELAEDLASAPASCDHWFDMETCFYLFIDSLERRKKPEEQMVINNAWRASAVAASFQGCGRLTVGD